jgi:antagonist of KipI
VLIEAGDRIRFERVRELPPSPSARPSEFAAGEPAIEVLDGGLLTTVQDAGRPGQRRHGVSAAGALDASAHAAVNLAVGNAPGAAALELTLLGPTLRFLRPVTLAWDGADLQPVLERPDLGAWPVPAGTPVLARAGNVLRFGARRSGCRAHLAFAGGLDVPLVLGSRSTDLVGGFGGYAGRPLRPGDVLAVGHAAIAPPRPLPAARPRPPATLVKVRVVLGPQAELFTEEAIATFLGATFRVNPASDRVGLRLTGPRLAHAGATGIVTDGLVPGCLQVPPDGQPILTLADGPTTGGYPKIATVMSADLDALAQLVPGDGEVRFEPV